MAEKITVRLDKLSKIYRRKEERVIGIDNIDLSINPGEILGLLGPNGAGKTTMLKLVATLIRKTSGNIYYNDFSLEGGSEKQLMRIKQQIGYVAEMPFFYNKLSGREYLTFIGKIYGIYSYTAHI